jgi:hypothetical protein
VHLQQLERYHRTAGVEAVLKAVERRSRTRIGEPPLLRLLAALDPPAGEVTSWARRRGATLIQ